MEYTTLVVYTHLRTAPLFASVPLPSLSLLSSLMQQHEQHQQLLQLQQQQQQGSPRSSAASDARTPSDSRVYPQLSPLQQQHLSVQAAIPTSPWQHRQQQQQQQPLLLPRPEEVCLSCGKRPEGCVVYSSPTATTVEVLLAGLHRQRHQGPLLSFLAMREAGPSILMSAVSTFLGTAAARTGAPYQLYIHSNLTPLKTILKHTQTDSPPEVPGVYVHLHVAGWSVSTKRCGFLACFIQLLAAAATAAVAAATAAEAAATAAASGYMRRSHLLLCVGLVFVFRDMFALLR